MDVTIYGSGYVGLVTGACLAEVGHHLLCVDIDRRKIESLKEGKLPIYEPGLDSIVERNMANGRLSFTTSVDEGVEHGPIQFIAVGTPPDEDGAADLRYVREVARTVGDRIREYRLLCLKSTVPVGTCEEVKALVASRLVSRGVMVEFDVASNPEFLKEGAAVSDFMKPDRIVIGTDSHRATQLLQVMYAPFTRNHNCTIQMDVRSAELTKYAANAMLATRISFMNELANLAERVGASIERVRQGIGSDPRIGYQFLYAGCGFGGSCFPKDVSALARTGESVGYTLDLLEAVQLVNERQKRVLIEKIERHYKGDLRGKTFAVWGLAFKPNTDDMRDAPSRVIIEGLWRGGAHVRAFDPVATQEAHRIYGDRDNLTLCNSKESAAEGADALVLVTEWMDFRSPDFQWLRGALKEPVVFDGRNLFDPDQMAEEGFTYYGIGSGTNSR